MISNETLIPQPMVSEEDNNKSKIGIQIYIAIVAMLLIITFISFICTRMGKRREGGHDEEDDGSSLYGEDSTVIIDMVGIDQAALNAYPTLIYSEIKAAVRCKASEEDGRGDIIIFNGKTTTCCSICLEEYENDHRVRLLPDCCHFFHVKCVDPWLKLKPNCPVCRKFTNPVQHWSRNNTTMAGLGETEHSPATATADQRV